MTRKFAVIMTLIVLGISSPALADRKSAVASVIVQIQKADYEGNRSELKRLYDDLAPFVRNDAIGSRVRYWRGFALWRRALNGFNDSVEPEELQRDLELAAREFQEASVADPHFADAKVGQGSCLSNLIYLNRGNPSRLQELVSQSRQVLKEAESLAPDNPRLAWVLGPNLWYSSQQNLENQGKAIEIYQRALEKIQKQKSAPIDPLEPSWGEPELLMNLAWSNLHRKTPDLQAARTDAQAALALVPYWHYVKDILIPQIQNAIDGRPFHAVLSFFSKKDRRRAG
jgi:tetratricopeptide (TPR) repeat protein